MINQIEIKNYRSHEHTVLDLTDRVNVIVGRGQAGKTNIRRAVEWVRTNRPLGVKFISFFAGDNDPCVVGITVTNPDGKYYVTASRARNGKMSYAVIDPSGTTHDFDTPGTKVPDLVTRVLNMDEINIHDQLSAPYLITGSTGEISRAVNRVIQAEEADKWITELNSRRNANAANIKTHEAAVETGEKRLAALAPLDHVAELITIADRTERQINQKERQAARLKELIDQYRDAQNEMKRISFYVDPLAKLVETAEAIDAEIQQNEARASAINAFLTARSRVDWYEKQYQDIKHQYIETITELGECPTCFSHIGRDVIRAIEEGL